MVKKQPPADFNPHPGDPWHPDWSADQAADSEEDRDNESSWWQRLLRRRDDSGAAAAVPDVYATLEDSDAEPVVVDEPSVPIPVAESVSVAAINVTESSIVEVAFESVESVAEPVEVVSLVVEPEPEVMEEVELLAPPSVAETEAAEVVPVTARNAAMAEAYTLYEDYTDWNIKSASLSEALSEAPVEPSRNIAVSAQPVADAGRSPSPPAAPAVVVPPGPSLDLIWTMEREARAKAAAMAEPAATSILAEPHDRAVVDRAVAEPSLAEGGPVATLPAVEDKLAPAAAVAKDGVAGAAVVAVPPGPSLDLIWSMERAAAASRVAPQPEPQTDTGAEPAAIELPTAPIAVAEPPIAAARLSISPAPLPISAMPTFEEETAAAEAAIVRAKRRAAELRGDLVLAEAGAAAHEEARMWAGIADARDQQDLGRPPEREFATVPIAASRVAPDELAAQARRIEAAQAGFDEARRRAEAEVRQVLLQEPGAHPGQAVIVELPEATDVAARFAAIESQLRRINDAEADRLERSEQLSLWTSLLLLDAEQPWDVGGWSRPGSSLSHVAPGTDSPQLLLMLQSSIATGSSGSVPESARRRRRPWSKRQTTPTAPSAPQDSLRSVIVIEERSVPDQQDAVEPEGQESFSLDDPDVSPPDEAIALGGDLEDELSAWSDLDWDLDEPEAPDTAVTPDDSAIEFDGPLFTSPDSVDSDDPVDSIDDSPDSAGHNWDSFTAEEYAQTSTHEYANLAAAVAASEAEAPEQAALSADMPGLESTLVSLDDVVEAEGMERAEAQPHRSDLALRVVTALVLVSLFFASLTYRWTIGLLVLVIMSVAAGEITTALVNRSYHPVALFSYLGTAGALLGAWAYGPVAIPIAVAVTLLVVVLFFGLVTGRQDPLVGMALTVAVVLWVGVMGAFAYDLIPAPEYRWLIAGFVVVVALMDVAQYFVGKRFGKRALAPTVSPNKTVAGLVGGVVAAIAVGYGFSLLAPFDAKTGIVLGAALAVTGPLGDLAVSVLKRSMGVKDMSPILPGHGGVIDRIDAILFSLPAAWAVYAWAGLLT